VHGKRLAGSCLPIREAAGVVSFHHIVHHGLAYKSEDIFLCAISADNVVKSVVMMSIVHKQVQA
jgi:hypothetical protein